MIFRPINQKQKRHGSHIVITLILLSLIILIVRGEPGQSSAHRRLDCWSLMSTGNVKCGWSMNRHDKQGVILGLWVQDIPRDKTAPPPQTPIAPELNEFRRQKICWGRHRCGMGYCAGPSGPGCVREVSGRQGALMNAAEPPRLPLLGISPLVLRPCLPRNLISTANICESPEIKLCPLAVRDQSGQIHLPPFLCQANQGEIMMGGQEGGPWATKPLWAPLNRVRVRWHLLNSLALVLNRGGLSWGYRLQDLPDAVS